MNSSAPVKNSTAILNPFALYCYANRGPETRLRHAVGLIERHLETCPHDIAANGCRAGLLMQSSVRNHPERKTDLYRLVAVRTQEAILGQIDKPDRGKVLFVYGTSLAQIGPDATFDQMARSRLQQFLEDHDTENSPLHCRYEVMIALSLLAQENRQPAESKALFINAQNKLGRQEAVSLLEDCLLYTSPSPRDRG